MPWRQIDLSGLVIGLWEKIGLVRNVRRPTAEQIGRKLRRRRRRLPDLTARGVSGRILLGENLELLRAVRGRELPD